jgi:hypothetical protein
LGHSRFHGMESIYFSLLTGGMIFISFQQVISNSLYENKIGISWTANREGDDFALNTEEYRRMVHLLLTHGIVEYLNFSYHEQN